MRTLHAVTAALALAAAGSPILAQGAPAGFLEEFEGQFAASASKLVALAEAMPAETYGWRPMEGVASVAAVYMHVASYNYSYPEESLGVSSPMGAEEYGRWEREVTEKEQVVEILRASMEHVRDVVERIGEDGLDDRTRLYGREVGKWAVLFQLVAHMNEHLGQSIAYARMNEVVPPWSR